MIPTGPAAIPIGNPTLARGVSHDQRDHVAAVRRLACQDFPFEMKRGLELALFRTFCVPSIARLLGQSGGFVRHGHQRRASTDVLLSDLLEHGYDSESGRAAIARMNESHRHSAIANDDFLYVLSTVVYEPIRCIDRLGRRALDASERDAFFQFWQAVGARLHIRSIPDDYLLFERFNREYEARCFDATDAGRRLAVATRDAFVQRFPRLLHPLARATLHALLGDDLARMLGLTAPSPLARRLVSAALRGRAHMARSIGPGAPLP